MGNCISKINKDHFFVTEEFMKTDILFSNGVTRLTLECDTKKTYTEVHFIKKNPEKINPAPLQTGLWWRDL